MRMTIVICKTHRVTRRCCMARRSRDTNERSGTCVSSQHDPARIIFAFADQLCERPYYNLSRVSHGVAAPSHPPPCATDSLLLLDLKLFTTRAPVHARTHTHTDTHQFHFVDRVVVCVVHGNSVGISCG